MIDESFKPMNFDMVIVTMILYGFRFSECILVGVKSNICSVKGAAMRES